MRLRPARSGVRAGDLLPSVPYRKGPMITRLEIRGYKSLGNVELTRLGPLVLVYGPNGVGKSNLLDALDLVAHLVREDTLVQAFQKHRGNRLDRPLPVRWFFHGANEESAGPELRMAFEVDLSLQARIREKLNGQLQERELAERKQAYTRVSHENLRYCVAITYDKGTRSLQVVEESLEALTKDGAHNQAVKPFIRLDREQRRATVKLEKQSHPRVFTFPRDRTILSEVRDLVNHPHLVAAATELESVRVYYVEPTRMRLEVNDVEATDPGSHGEFLASFYHWLERTDPIGFKNLVLNLKRLVPGVRGIEVREGAEGFLELWVEEEGRGEFHASMVSEGTLRILCLLGIAVTPQPPAVVGYEEPENGVNPARLREMLEILSGAAEDERQFVLTTHSPLVMDALQHAVRIRCERSNGGTRFLAEDDIPLFQHANARESLGTAVARGDLD